MESESEKLLISRWLSLLQKYYRLYNIDYSHQCLSQYNARSSSIIRVFQGIDYFFGCIQCGQYHICRRSLTGCYVTSNYQQQRLFCLYSGQLIEDCENYEKQPVSLNKDNNRSLEHSDKDYNTGVSLYINGEQSKPYTNMKTTHTRQYPLRGEKVEEAEWSHPTMVVEKKEKRKKPDSNMIDRLEEELEGEFLKEDFGGEIDGNLIVNGTDEDYFHQKKRLKRDQNYQYWNQYYSFLWEKRVFPSIAETSPPPPPIPPSPTILKKKFFDYNINQKEPDGGKEIENQCHILIERLLLLASPKSENKEEIFLLLLDYFTPLVKNLYLLVHNSSLIEGVALDRRNAKSIVMNPKQITEVVLLHLLTEPCDAEDICQHFIRLWVGNPWLTHLMRSGIIKKYYSLYLNKNGNTIKRATNLKNDLKECLSVYFIHTYWLKDFIHSNRRYQ